MGTIISAPTSPLQGVSYPQLLLFQWLVISPIEDNQTFFSSARDDDDLSAADSLSTSRVDTEEDQKQFQLLTNKQDDVRLTLVYAILTIEEVSTLKLYRTDHDKAQKPIHNFVLRRKECLIRETVFDLGIKIQVQDVSFRYRYKQVQFYVPTQVQGLSTVLLGMPGFEQWLSALRVCNRPIMSPDEVDSCFLCQNKFNFFNRQQHCHKCGISVCNDCSKYFVRIPDYGYNGRVRACRNCIEQIYIQKINEENIQVQSPSKSDIASAGNEIQLEENTFLSLLHLSVSRWNRNTEGDTDGYFEVKYNQNKPTKLYDSDIKQVNMFLP